MSMYDKYTDNSLALRRVRNAVSRKDDECTPGAEQINLKIPRVP